MSLLTEIQKNIIFYLKNKQEQNAELKVSVLRLLSSAIKYKQLAVDHELSDKEVIGIIQQAIKQREESIVQYQKAGRDTLAAREQEEIMILSKYLPEEISIDSIKLVVRDVILEKQQDQKFALLQKNAAFGLVIKQVLLVLDKEEDKIYSRSIVTDVIHDQLSK